MPFKSDKAIVVDASSYLLQVSRYIHRNPIELKKPLVKHLEDYRWSSYSAYLNQEKIPNWLNRDSVYDEVGSRNKYRAFVELGNDNEISRFYNLKNTPSIMGDKLFKERAYGQSQSLAIEIDKKGLKQPVDLLKIVGEIANMYDVTVEDICVAKRGKGVKNIPRWIAMKLCQELGGAKLTEIAKVFNIGHYSTVSQTIKRLNVLMEEDNEVFSIFNMLSQDLTP